MRFIKYDYVDIEMKQNRTLPPWLETEISQGVLIFTGEPEPENVGDYLIQIKNKFGYVV